MVHKAGYHGYLTMGGARRFRISILFLRFGFLLTPDRSKSGA